MKLRAWAPVFGVALVVGGPATAQEFPDGMYIGVRGIGSFAKLHDVDTNGFTGSRDIQNDTDTVAGVGGMVGYRWQDIPLRTEMEAAYRFRFDFDLQDRGAPAIDYEDNLSTITVLFNALFEWRNQSDFTPFIGGTVGWARHTSDTKRVNIGTQASSSDKFHENNFAWGGMAGLDWHFAQSWSAEVAYRYLDMGEVDAGSFSGGDSVSADHYTTHDVLLSVSFRF